MLDEQQLIEKRKAVREQYLEYLSGKVSYKYGKQTYQSRVKKPEQWKKVPECVAVDISAENVWVWSDLHFGHQNIIHYSDRPFPDVPTMDRHLIENFNDYVGPQDTSIWVGDITFYEEPQSKRIVRECNGYKILVAGNHDFDHGKLKKMAFDEVHISYVLNVDGINLVFTHYPIPVEYPDINVHGHEHISKKKTEFSELLSHINVCCEFHQYKPLNLSEIVRWAKIRIESFDKKRGSTNKFW